MKVGEQDCASIQIYTYSMRGGIALLGHLYLCRYDFPLSRRLVAGFSRRRAAYVGFVVKKWHWDRFLSEYFDSIFAYKHRSTDSAYSFDSSAIELPRSLQFVCTYKHWFNILKIHMVYQDSVRTSHRTACVHWKD